MKKFISLLLSLCLLLGTLPLQVSAFAGDIFPSESTVKTVTLNDGSLSLQNEYIHMTFRKLWGSYAYLTVVPAAKSDEESILIGQTPRCTFITYDQGREKTEGVVTEPIKAEFVTKTPNGSANAIKVEYSLLTSLSLIKAKATVYYELVQLKETGASSDTWGVLASVSEICIDEDSMPQDWNRDFNFKWGYSFNCFTATGHTSTLEKPGGPAIKMSRTTVPEGENPQITTENSVFTASVEDLSTKTVPKGYSEWGDVDGVYTTEVYTDGYPWANPFVGLSDYYEKDITSVSGKPIRVALAQTVSVTPGDKPLNTWVQCDSYTGFTFEEPNGSEEYSHFLWGFHDLIKAGTENVPSRPDAVNTAINAKRLAAFAVNGGVTVEYVLRTYLANAEGGADYLVEEQIVADPENIAVNIPESGTLAPTGEYYVTSFLMTEKETDLDGDGVMEKALAAIDSNQFNSKISYTNTKQPESPAHVNLEAAGNEVMRAEWQQVDNADGYRVTIYQQQNGGWVDTGFGYELNKETTSIDMALTVGGEETAESKNLSANETYKVGVSAYTQAEDGAKYYSAETESSGVFLPEYTPLNLALSVNGKDCTPDENGVYHAYVGGSSNSLAVTCAESESITVTRMDTDAPLTSDGANTFAIPDFTGTLMLRVNGVKGKDVTGVFLLVSRDTTAPVLTLSAPIFYADRAAGSYQITGTADAGSEVLYGENNESVYAAGDGSFAIQGTLEERQDGDALYIRAQDSAGNLSARQLALVARQAETYAVTVTTDGNGTASADLAAAAAGTNISLSATPNTGYHFKEWQVVSGGVTIENDKFTMPDGNVEIKAIFEKDAAPATPAPTATPKPESSPTPAPAATAKPNSSTPPAPAAAAKPDSSTPPAPAAAAKPNSSPTPAPVATAKPESSPALAPTATAKPDSSPTPAPTAPATKLPVWWVALPIVGGVALAGVFVMRKKKRRR